MDESRAQHIWQIMRKYNINLGNAINYAWFDSINMRVNYYIIVCFARRGRMFLFDSVVGLN